MKVSFSGFNEMISDLDKKLNKMAKKSKRSIDGVVREAKSVADYRVPQPGGSAYGKHPWAVGGLKENLFTIPSKDDDGVIHGSLISDQPPPGTFIREEPFGFSIVQPGYNIDWDEGNDAPYMRDTVEDVTPSFERAMDDVAEELE